MIQMAQISTENYEPAEPLRYSDFSSSQWTSKIESCLAGGRYKLADGHYQLSEEVRARCAVSCVIAPEEGDTVLCYSHVCTEEEGYCKSPEIYVLAVLHREEGSSANLTVPNCDNLKISQPSIQCHAREKLELGCLENIELTSVKGNVEMRAQNLVQTVVGSIIESAKERISNADFIQFCASFLTRIHSSQTIITADSDIKIDAERVNLG